jgi:hypothetical protein
MHVVTFAIAAIPSFMAILEQVSAVHTSKVTITGCNFSAGHYKTCSDIKQYKTSTFIDPVLSKSLQLFLKTFIKQEPRQRHFNTQFYWTTNT